VRVALHRRLVRGICVESLEAVDHDDPGPSLSEGPLDSFKRPFEPVLGECPVHVLVEDGLPDRLRVEEGQGLPEAHELVEGLRDGGEVDRAAVR
jgi:hypothetical protein